MLKTYAYHKPSQSGLTTIQAIRLIFSQAQEKITAIVPNSRERNVAFTHLETAQMWVNKGIVLNDPDSVICE